MGNPNRPNTKRAGIEPALFLNLYVGLPTQTTHIRRCVIVLSQTLETCYNIGRALRLHSQAQITSSQEIHCKLTASCPASLSLGAEIRSLSNFLDAPQFTAPVIHFTARHLIAVFIHTQYTFGINMASTTL